MNRCTLIWALGVNKSPKVTPFDLLQITERVFKQQSPPILKVKAKMLIMVRYQKL